MMATENSFLDDILNFSGDEDDEGVPVGGDQHRHQQQELSELSSFESSESHQNLLNIFKHYDSIHVGEELEWVSSFLDDSSLALETSDSEQQKQQQQQQQRQEPEKKTHQFSKKQNPVSILGSSMEPCLFRAGLVIPARARSKRMRAPSTSVSSLWCEAIRVPSKREKPRRCGHCGVEKTPQWRTGPLGPKTLCNACGVRYKSGRLLPEYRPAGSPSFSSDLHSNCHRKIVEMRRQKQQQQVVL